MSDNDAEGMALYLLTESVDAALRPGPLVPEGDARRPRKMRLLVRRPAIAMPFTKFHQRAQQ